MTNNAYIGIDLGTSGCRAIAIDQQDNIIASCQQSLTTTTAVSAKSEQDPFTHWQLVEQVLTELIPQLKHHEVESIAVDATSGSILLTDQYGKPLTPIIMYNDSRAIEQSQHIATIAPAESGCHGASSGLAKLLYCQQHNKIASTSHLLHQADWINFKLGAPLGISDENNSLKTGYDLVNRNWPQWIDQLTDRSLLPKVVPPGTIIGKLSKQLCLQFHLSNTPNIVAGTTDSIAALLATGANKLGDAVTSLGSTLVVKLISEHPIYLPEQGVYSHRLGDLWLVGGASNTGGAVLKHFFDKNELQRLSELIIIGSDVPDYYPLLAKGERFPINDPQLIPKLSPRSSNDVEFLHGMLKGIANIEHQAYQVLQDAGATPVNSIRTVGGGAVNIIWQAIREQINPISFITAKYTEAAYGAALLAKGHI